MVVFFLLAVTIAFAQEEYLSPLNTNQVIKNYRLAHPELTVAAKLNSMAGDTLSLPVFDDFSAPGIYPDPAIWQGRNVFINSGYSINSPTVGMATFDGLDEFGDPYDKTYTTQFGSADTLESKPVNLYDDSGGNPYTSADSITFSFYFQRRGLGDGPEFGDSLQVEFWDPSSAQWYWQWSFDGGTFDVEFKRVFIFITDTLYFKKGFKFRFRSYGSLVGSLDNWNLDYVILRKPFFTNDTLINDIGYQLPAHSLIRNYTSIPYDHYKFLGQAGQDNLMLSPDSLAVFNLFNTASAPSQANFRIYEQSGGLQYQFVTTGNGNIVIPPDTVINYGYPTPALNYRFPDTIPGDFAEFKLVDNLASPNQDFNKNNDTVRYRQIFSNYYAYDDGSAEASYSLNTAPGGKLACSFDLIKGDTLRGLFIHWCQKKFDVSLKLFKIVVWQSISPSEVVLYQELNQKPMYTDSIDGFRYYRLSSEVVLPAGTFYIGIVQSAIDELYLGFDRNIDAGNKKWFNTTGTWQNSQIPGSFMMRPVFGDSVITTGVANEPLISNHIQVFPNPANDQLHVTSNLKSLENIKFEITDLTGRRIEGGGKFSKQIDIRHLPEGFYFIRFYYDKDLFFSFQKFVIARH